MGTLSKILFDSTSQEKFYNVFESISVRKLEIFSMFFLCFYIFFKNNFYFQSLFVLYHYFLKQALKNN